MRVFVCLCGWLFVCWLVGWLVGWLVFVCVCVCLFLFLFVCVCVSLRVCVCVSVCLYIHIHTCIFRLSRFASFYKGLCHKEGFGFGGFRELRFRVGVSARV